MKFLEFFKFWKDDRTHLQKILEEEGAFLEDIPSFTPEDIERIIREQRKICNLRRASKTQVVKLGSERKGKSHF